MDTTKKDPERGKKTTKYSTTSTSDRIFREIFKFLIFGGKQVLDKN